MLKHSWGNMLMSCQNNQQRQLEYSKNQVLEVKYDALLKFFSALLLDENSLSRGDASGTGETVCQRYRSFLQLLLAAVGKLFVVGPVEANFDLGSCLED